MCLGTLFYFDVFVMILLQAYFSLLYNMLKLYKYCCYTMTLIDSNKFHTLINTFGTIVFVLTLLWAVWFASKMD
ncbi:hypothetical protein Sta7437_2353 [Stanieria cyanosphaera PCC 7437]|uniref:Uncharacterized protein n=1 Tax=Stanieria cyanosphaera (strain ATCC 29371 / PCC 7437) TaxID=111780 RepID=K9XV04_STAC7|nr:hypothetical protein Sta7437_2353 [Stanieria cyanosphaera PCC 7437]